MDISALCKHEFTIRETKFKINKLNAFDGFKVLDSLRERLTTQLSQMDLEKVNLKELILAVMSLPREYLLDYLIPALFCEVAFANKTAPQYCPIVSPEILRTAFSGLEPGDVYDVLLRAVCVNFYQSFAGKTALFSKLSAI